MPKGRGRISKTIPIPAKRKGAYRFDQLKVGESFKVSKRIESLRVCASEYGKRHGQKFSVHALPNGTARCWRVK